MQHPQVVVFERDGRLAEQLQPLAAAERWPLREARREEPCLRWLRQAGVSVLVVKISRDNPGRELALAERVGRVLPEVPVVVVGEPEDAAMNGLAWDLGAAFALFAPLSRELLPGVVHGLMRKAAEAVLPGGRP